MANRRMISKTISTSRKVNRLSDRASLIYTWMQPHTDDYGRLEGDALSLKAKVVPMRPDITEKEIEEDLNSMVKNNLIIRYEVDGERYIEIIGFDKFQTFRSDRPRQSLYPSHTNDIPTGDIVRPKRREVKLSNKIREDKIYATQKYLLNIPKEDIETFTDRFEVTEKQIRSKAEDLKLYCDRKGKKYNNYKSFLLNALKNDFKERESVANGKYKNL